ncbi:MAG TPA: PEP/pyruvate-binding domain-containing protein [Anaerolineae bacterium]|nr:PEP/pyruvate-binding domain-containing protein [Anaerolineae bacterium]
MLEPIDEASDIVQIYSQLTQYPILAPLIRERMREELFRRGIVRPDRLEEEVKDRAIISQKREGLNNPMFEEDEGIWLQRLRFIRDYLTDFYFAHNLPVELLDTLIDDVVGQRAGRAPRDELHFNPELAPLEMLLNKAQQYELLPPDDLAEVHHHLEEIIVVLVRTVISDQLHFVRIAKAYFTVDDFRAIRSRRIGNGKIGGKAAGMLLAQKILEVEAPELAQHITVPESYFIGADVFYDFISLNNLEYNQKYKSADQIRAEYPVIRAEYEKGRFPEEVAERLRAILDRAGNTPLIVRSSSLLEDNFGTSFAGKYESHFCPNQGTPRENLRALTTAIRRIYASVYNPDALFYRRRMGLLDYDERMAILLQVVQGQSYHRYFFPALAGVALGRAPIVWNPRLRRDEGFVRLVNGLGTRAVNRVADDYPRLITLSHPTLRPETSPQAIQHYSQHMIDLIDLEANEFATVPVKDVLKVDYDPLRWIASINEDDTLMPMVSLGRNLTPDRFVLTFDNLVQRTDFVHLIKDSLAVINKRYNAPVEMEFAATITPTGARPNVTLHLLQCRPQSSLREAQVQPAPTDLTPADRLFISSRMVPQGQVSEIEYIFFVKPQCYSNLPAERRHELARVIGRLNKNLEGHKFIMVGPGRWGSSNIDLGVPVSYADIYNSSALIELAYSQKGITPEPSYGTHFFQDLVESQIYPLAVYPDQPGDLLNEEFFNRAKNQLAALLPESAEYSDCLKVIHAPGERPNTSLEISMDGERAVAYFAQPVESLRRSSSPKQEVIIL